MSDKDKLAETAEYYDTHDISADMEAGEWSRHEGKLPETAMSGFNTRLPTAVLNDAGHRAGPATGAWIREVIEVAVAWQKGGRHGAHVSPACRRRGILAPPGLLTSSPTDDPARIVPCQRRRWRCDSTVAAACRGDRHRCGP
jgi:hypothetical protein